MNITIDTAGPSGVPDLIEIVGFSAFLVITTYDYIMLIMGIFGNLIILYTTAQYNAIDLDKVSLIYVKNMTVANFAWTLITTLTLCVSNTCHNTWCMGDIVCVSVAYLRNPLAATEILFICLISTHRLWTISMALRMNSYTTLHAKLLSAAAWVLPLLIVALCLCHNIDVVYDPALSTCKTLITSEENIKLSAAILTFMLVMLPFAVTILSNLCLLYYAVVLSDQHRAATYKRALLTVFVLCGTFVLTGIPNMVRLLMPIFGKPCPISLQIFNTHIYLINSSCDSILFTITSRRFRNFIFKKILRFRVLQIGANNSVGSAQNLNLKKTMLSPHGSKVCAIEDISEM